MLPLLNRRPTLILLISTVGLILLAVVWRNTYEFISYKQVIRHSYSLNDPRDGNWTAVGGNWLVQDGIATNTRSEVRGPKLMSGSGRWRNYTLAADIRFASERGDMGVIVRSNDEEVGTDAYNGYYVGLRMDSESLIIGRSNFGWVEARPVGIPGGVHPNLWYRLRVTAFDCHIAASVENITTKQTAWVAFEEHKCVRSGRIGLRAVDVEGFWRNISVAPASLQDYLEMQQHTDSVERPVVLSGPPWWTPSRLALLFASILVLAMLIQLSYYHFERWKSRALLRERERLAHDIHDTMAQSFAGLGYHIQGIGNGLAREGPLDHTYIRDQLNIAYQLIRRCHREASETIAMLSAPSPMGNHPLEEALAKSAQEMAGHGIVITTECTGERHALSLPLADALHHIGKEAIANAVSHSHLTELKIVMAYQAKGVELAIIDNGNGFDQNSGVKGFGIAGMQKRARGVSGNLKITSVPGSGTEVRVTVSQNQEGSLRTALLTLKTTVFEWMQGTSG